MLLIQIFYFAIVLFIHATSFVILIGTTSNLSKMVGRLCKWPEFSDQYTGVNVLYVNNKSVNKEYMVLRSFLVHDYTISVAFTCNPEQAKRK